MTRHWKILEYALASLLRRKGKNGAVIAVFTFTVASLASILFLTDSLKAEARALLVGVPDMIVQRISAGRSELVALDDRDPIRAIPGVARVDARYWGYYYDALVDANYTVLGVTSGGGELELLRGRLPKSPGECAVGQGVARVRGLAVGDDLILVDARGTGTSFFVVGVFEAPSRLLTNDLVVLGERDLIDFFGLPPGRATDLVVRVNNPAEISTVARKVTQALPGTRPISRSEVLRTYDAVLDWRSGLVLAGFSAALAAFCILAWDKATGISAEERQEIGILKAIGWDTADVLEFKFWEGVAISFTSLLLGVLLAYVHVFFLGAPLLAAVLKGWSVLFPAFDLVPRVEPGHLLSLGLFTVAPYVASTVIPSWRAAITDPDAVMRG